jgi:hypothetical protein
MRQTLLFLGMLLLGTSCLRYSFSGVAIPPEVRTIHIPLFPDQSGSGLTDLSNQLNAALVDRFVNQTRLLLINDASAADIVIEGAITGYRNLPFVIAGNQQTSLNRITVTVRASIRYRTEDRERWNKGFIGTGDFDPASDPIRGEENAAAESMDKIAQNMFSDSIGRW